MSDVTWSYGPLKNGRVVDFDKNDMTVAEELNRRIDTLNTCIACGLCTSTCSAGAFTDFNIRKLQTLIRRGVYLEAREEAQKCMMCGKCLIVCPRGINLRKVVLQISALIK